MIDYEGFALPKPRPLKAVKDERKATVRTMDKRESDKARIRANGQCETRLSNAPSHRCPNRDTQTHHLIGGIGRRNRGKSILAEYKLRVCDPCHEAITGKTLVPTTADHTAYTVRYRRVK